MNRADRRRYAKEVAKGNIGLSAEPRSKLMPSEIVGANGKHYTNVKDYLEYAEDELAKDISKKCSEICSQMLYETETYIGVAEVLIMLVAVEKAVGNLKTVQKSFQKIIDNINDAADCVDSMGIRNTYEVLKEKYGINLEFQDVDLNWVDDDGAEVYKRFKLHVS